MPTVFTPSGPTSSRFTQQETAEKTAREFFTPEAIRLRGGGIQARNQRLAAEKAAREKAAREKAAREKAAREKAAREKAAREKAAREKAAREKAARARTTKARQQARRIKKKVIQVQGGKAFITMPSGKTEIKLTKDLTLKERRQTSGHETKVFKPSQFKKKDLSKFSKKIVNLADIISGGSFTASKIQRDQGEVNQIVERFNKKFGGKTLSESEFKKATAMQKDIDSQQKRVNNRTDKLANSRRDAFRDFAIKTGILKLGTKRRLTIAEQKKVDDALKNNPKVQKKIKQNKSKINSQKIKNTKIRENIKNIQSKGKRKTFLDDLKLFKLKNQLNSGNLLVSQLEFRAPPTIRAGTVPVVPAARIPKGITKIRFVGAQKTGKDGKVVTDIFFQTKKGVQGIARGVSVTRKGKTTAVVAGRFGKVTVKVLGKGKKIKGIKSFVGLEKSVTKGAKFTTSTLKKIAKFTQKSKHKNVIRVIKTNIRGLQQSGVGRVVTIKGKKFFKPFIKFPSGKLGTRLGKGIDLDDFASISAILSKKDISAIVGKTITAKGRKAEFIGLIKSLAGGTGDVVLTTIEKQQYSKAMQKLVGSISAAVARAERTGGFASKSLRLAAAAKILSKAPLSTARISNVKTTLVKRKVISKKSPQIIIKQPTKITSKKISITKSKSITQQKQKAVLRTQQVTLQANLSSLKQRVKLLSKGKHKTKQVQKQLSRARQLQRQVTKQLQKLKTRQKQVTKQISQGRFTTISFPIVPSSLLIPIAKLKKKKVKKIVVRKKGKNSFDVFAKPVKGKRLVKINKRPLSKNNAKDLRNYIVDTSLARTGKIKGRKGKSKKPLLKVPRGYAKKTTKKFRRFRTVKGKRKPLKKGKVIERRKRLLDTRQERRKITLRRRIKQITPRKKKVTKRKPIKRKVVRKAPRPQKKRAPIRKTNDLRRQQLLRNLKKARMAKARLQKNQRRSSTRTKLRQKISIV